MAVTQGLFLAAVLLPVFSGLHCSSVLTGCPEPCTCQTASLVNCSSSGLTLVPQPIQESVTNLDLSRNLLDSVTFKQPYHSLKNVWLGSNSITRLSLCIERYLGARTRNIHGLRSWSRRGCVSWAPTLQLLSVESNQLDQLPEGLEGSESLQVLQLSFNKISTLRPGDLSLLPQLTELHLQHNLITSLHPQMFQNLSKLQVLDLSFNKLTSLHPVMYRSLRNILADVRLGGNRWQCDCTMRSLRRWMTYDSSRGLQAWSVVCASPSVVSGRDLLQLEEDDLNCFSGDNRAELHQDVTVYRGSEILLSCTSQDSMWWTPSGQASVRQPQAGLVIADITERDAGLYVCVSEEHEVVSVFNLQISKVENPRRRTRRFSRSSRQIIPQGTLNTLGEQKRNQRAAQSDLALAVCLSVFITFLVAFILGVLARPCVDVLWRRVTKKKRSTETKPVSSVEQRQYDNEAYSNGEEPEVIHRERRVTFSTIEIRETSNVQYYDTVASGEQQSVNSDVVIECEAAKAERDTCTAGDSGSENSLQQSSSEKNQEDVREVSGVPEAGCRHNMEFEHIPDPVEPERRSLSSCSDSSLSDKECKEDQMTQRKKPKSAQLVEDSIQQRADLCTATEMEVQQISTEDSEIPGFPSEPFSDWSPHTKNPNLTDPDLWQDNEEQFEFSDSVQSTSARSSSVGVILSNSKLTVSPASDKQRRDDTSSSSSYVDEDEPTEYTVNDDQEEDIERNLSNAFLKRDAGFHKKIHVVDSIVPSVGFNQTDYRYDEQSHAVRAEHSFSSHSSDSDGEDNIVKQETDKGEGKDKSICVFDKSSSSIVSGEWDTSKVKPMPRTKWRVLALGVTSQGKSLDTGAPSPPAAYSSSSSSESEEQFKHLEVDLDTVRLTGGIKIDEQGTLLTNLDHQCIPQIKSHLNINAPSPSSNPSSSDESMDEPMKRTKREEQGDVDMTGLPVKVCQSASKNARKTQWPSLDLGHVTPIKTDLVIKGPSPTTNSSSTSDSEEETTGLTEKKRPVKVDIEILETEVLQTQSHYPDIRWPVLDLELTTHIKKRLDIKPPSLDSDSSSSSDSEDETMAHIEKKRPVKVGIAGLQFQESQAESPDERWPVLDLERSTRIKRRLDIKPASPDSDSSSSSDSEDETTGHIEKKRPVKVDTDILETEILQTKGHDPENRWPVLDLELTTHIKRRLDIKPPSLDSDSSSSSDSEDETTGHIEKHWPGKVDTDILETEILQTKGHDPENSWPVLDLELTTHIKRRLDIKPASPDSDSSSSSDSEDETTVHIEKHWPVKVDTDILETEILQTKGHDPDNSWPVLDLEHTTRLKRRLDIKPPSLDSDSSSSSDSEDETMAHIEKKRPVKVGIAGLPFQESQTESPDERWPVLDLERSTRIKRRLDIKPASPDSDSSSSSDSEDETTGHIEKKRPVKVDTDILETEILQTKGHDPENSWPVLDLERTTRLKRRLDIKPASPDSDSSSSSDSEDETTVHIEKRPVKVDTDILETEVLQTKGHDPENSWPVLDLEHTTRIKKRLDIKPPSLDSDSSSSSDSEDETMAHIEKKRPVKVGIAGFPFQESQAESPDERWPVLDLERTTRIKRRLDIKPASPDSDSSSSSDSEDETMGQIEKHWPVKVDTDILETEVLQTKGHDPENSWPVLDLEHTTRLKRRLDIKPASPDSDSSSSSDSEDETTAHIEKQRPVKVGIAGLQFQESQTECHDPDERWPVLDLERTTRIKRRLDIKPASPDSDSSSSSDSENETTGHIEKKRPVKVDTDILETEILQTKGHDPENSWPVLYLERTTRLKRRLDIKPASPDSDSSSSSDSEDETTGHIEKRPVKVDTDILETEVLQTKGHDPDNSWPVLDLEHTTRIKRRLDIKPASPASDSSSISDSENETRGHIEKKRSVKVGIAGFPFQESQAESPDERCPVLDLECTTRIKRRLDIKPASPASDSSSSGDSENETTGHIEKHWPGKVDTDILEREILQTKSHYPDNRWPVLDLEHTTRIKRRLDIKPRSPVSHLSPSSDSKEETTSQGEKQRPVKVGIAGLPFQESQTECHDPDERWPVLDLERTTRIKRRLDIKAPSPDSESSSSSESEDETTNQIKKLGQRETDMPRHPTKVSQTVSHEPQIQWPVLNLEDTTRIKRRLDIKPASPDSKSSSSSDSEDEKRDHAQLRLGASAIKATLKEFIRSPKTPMIHFYRSPKTDHNIKLEKYTAFTDDMGDKTTHDNIDTTPEMNPELESRWATMNLGISRFRKRLEITSLPRETPNLPSTPPPDSPFSSSSDIGTASTGSRTRRKRRDIGMEGILLNKSSPMAENKPVNVSLSLKGKDSGNSVEVEERLQRDYRLPKAEEKSNPDTMLTGFGAPHFRKYLDIKVSERAPVTPPLQQLHDTSSSSDNEDASTEYVGRGRSGRSQLSAFTNEEASQIQTTVYMSQSINTKLDQSQSQTEEEDRRAAVELKSQTKKVGVETHLSRTYIPQIRRALDIRAPLQRVTSSSSSSEDETKDLSVPDLSLGVPRVKRGLNIKAPLPGQSNSLSSSSENENEVTGYRANQSRHESHESRMTDDTPIAYYKRSIFQASLSQSDYFSHSGPTIDHTNKRHVGAEMATVADGGPSHSVGGGNASLPTVRVPRMSFDDVVKRRIEQSKGTTDVDMPSEIRWTGIGHRRTDLSISRARTHLNTSLSTPQQEPSAQTLDSSNYSRGESEYKIKQGGGKADGTLMHSHSSRSDSGVNRASSRAPDKFENSAGRTSEILKATPEDVRARKGLSALKAMSSERRTWDSQAEHLDAGASPLFIDHGPKASTSFNYQRPEDTELLTPQPQIHLSSLSVDDSRSTDQLYGIPRYRRHDIGRIEPPQETPPPIPATPPQDESVALTLRSTQRREQGLEGSRSYLQQSRSVSDSDPSSNTSQNQAVYLDSPNINISHV